MLRKMVPWLCSAAAATFVACAEQPQYPPPPVERDDVAISAAALPEGEPKFYSFSLGDRRVNFFVLRMNGNIQAYLDACATCYRKKKGYSHERGVLTCRACGERYGLRSLEQGFGGCYPIKLAGRVEKGAYRIPLASLAQARNRF